MILKKKQIIDSPTNIRIAQLTKTEPTKAILIGLAASVGNALVSFIVAEIGSAIFNTHSPSNVPEYYDIVSCPYRFEKVNK